MGSYATTTSIQHVLIRFLRSNTTTSDTFGTAVFSKHIDRAEAKVNSALARMYSIPFSPVPPEVRRLSEDIACYYVIRATNYQDGKNKNQYLEEFKTAFTDLAAISKGDKSLSYTDGSLVPVKSSNRFLSSTEGYTPIFGLDDPDKWQRDPDEIEDQEDARE